MSFVNQNIWLIVVLVQRQIAVTPSVNPTLLAQHEKKQMWAASTRN